MANDQLQPCSTALLRIISQCRGISPLPLGVVASIQDSANGCPAVMFFVPRFLSLMSKIVVPTTPERFLHVRCAVSAGNGVEFREVLTFLRLPWVSTSIRLVSVMRQSDSLAIWHCPKEQKSVKDILVAMSSSQDRILLDPELHLHLAKNKSNGDGAQQVKFRT
jgi:hypothetical protein